MYSGVTTRKRGQSITTIENVLLSPPTPATVPMASLSDVSPPQGSQTPTIISLSDDIRKLTSLCLSIRDQQDDLKKTLLGEIEKSKQAVLVVLDQKITDVNLDIVKVADRVSIMEADLKEVGVPEYHPDRSLVVSKLVDQPEITDLEQAQALISDGLGMTVEVKRAKRLGKREGNTGILKIEMPSTELKVQALRRKQNLAAKDAYKDVYVRSSQSHEERVAQRNLRTVIDALPGLSGRYHFAGNGVLVENTNPRTDRR